MNCSLNEAEALAKRAARGVGYSWGLAEEAAKATRRLCAFGLDGCGALAALLQDVEAQNVSPAMPDLDGETWGGDTSPLCPISVGAAYGDHARVIGTACAQFGAVAQPVLLIPFVATLARLMQMRLLFVMPDFQVLTDPDGLAIDGTAPALAPWAQVKTGADHGPLLAPSSRAKPNVPDWQILNRFAHRTYAPATEESRLKGAGADLSDSK